MNSRLFGSKLRVFQMAAASLLLCLAAGCGKGKEADDGRKVITILTSGTPSEEKLWAEMIPAFEKACPDIRINNVSTAPSEYYTKLQVMMAGGSPPDLAEMMTMRLPTFVHRKAFLPLDPFMEKDADFKARRADIYDKTLEGFGKEGKLYCMPYAMNLYAMYYNKTIFDNYNKTAPEGAKLEYPNGSWDLAKFVDAAKKLTQDTDGNGQVDQYGTILQGTPFYIICPILRRFGVELFNPEMTKCNLDDPVAIEAMEFYFGLALTQKVTPSPGGANARSESVVAGGPQEMFMAGKIAMWEAESEWRFQLDDRIKTFDWDIAEPPHGRQKTSGYECFGMSILSSTKRPEEAWKFLSFITGPEGQKLILKNHVGIPILKSLCNSEVFMDPKVRPVHKEVYFKTLEYGKDIPSLKNFQEVETAITDELMLGLLGNRSVAESCKAAAKAADKLLAENKE